MASDITDEMINDTIRDAYGHWIACNRHVSCSDHASGDLPGYLVARMTAALAGRTVVDLPEPSGHDEDGPYWMDSRAAVFSAYEFGRVKVRTDQHDLDPEAAEVDALALLAAVREARRLASESRKDGETPDA